MERAFPQGELVGSGAFCSNIFVSDITHSINRRPKLPPAGSLQDLVATSPPHNAARWLNVEVSFGRRDHDEGRNGTIVASTLPWREGQLAFPAA